MYNKRVKRLPKIIAGQLLVTATIAVVASFLIFYSQGYKINWKTFKFYKTGMILLISDPEPDKISINNIAYEPKTQFSKNFTPGYYDFVISKENYYDWKRTIYIESERLEAFKEIKLFLATPKLSELSDQSKINFLNSPNEYLAENSKYDLRYNGHELWANDSMITRLSRPVLSATWYPDYDHIVYQVENEIRIVEISGYNDTLLVRLSKDTPTRFVIGNKGKELYYLDNDVYHQAQIR